MPKEIWLAFVKYVTYCHVKGNAMINLKLGQIYVFICLFYGRKGRIGWCATATPDYTPRCERWEKLFITELIQWLRKTSNIVKTKAARVRFYTQHIL